MSATETRTRIHAGDIIRRPATAVSMALAQRVMQAVTDILGPEPRRAAERISDVPAALEGLRRQVTGDEGWWRLIAAVAAETGFDLRRQRFDAPRLRALPSHLPPAAVPRGAYAIHRDTWYGNPGCQVNWWLAAHDIDERESFAFYPKYFRAPIANDSSKLDFTRPWDRNAPPPAPDTLERPPISEGMRFSLAQGEMLMFSGAHLHGGVPVTSGLIRFSLDFRTVDDDDLAAGRSAPMLDVECRGDALADYVRIP